MPICADGYVEIADPENPDQTRHIGVTRAHLEEDAGKSMHDEAAGQAESRIDLNRCGTPLLEIVSEPDMRSAAEANAYLVKLKALMTHLGVSDCEMQQGSLRVDANVNLHLDVDGKKIATPIVEVKNMNSFRAVVQAIEFEVQRQYAESEKVDHAQQEFTKSTRGWDDERQITYLQREKEESADYRYFPDPDLLPIRIPAERVEAARAALGETPEATRERFENQFGIKPYDSDVIVGQGREMAEYFETVATRSGDGKRASSWIQQDVMRTMNDRQISIDAFPIDAEKLGDLLKQVVGGRTGQRTGRDVFAYLLGARCFARSKQRRNLGIEAVDTGAIESLCKELLEENPQVIEDVRGGKLQALGSVDRSIEKEESERESAGSP